MAATMAYRPTGLMICTNGQHLLQSAPKKKNPKELWIETSPNPNGLCITMKPKAPPRPPRRRLNQRIWDRIPTEVFLQIAQQLTPEELVKLGLTCKSAYRAVSSVNPLLLVRRQHFICLFKHLADVARIYDGRAAFITDADELFDELVISLRNCYGEATSHRLGYYSDFECDFILPVRDGRATHDMFVSDMLAVYGYASMKYYLEEEREGPPATAEEEFIRTFQPRHGRWLRISVPSTPEKKPSFGQRIKKIFGIPSNKVKNYPGSPPMSPNLNWATLSTSPKIGWNVSSWNLGSPKLGWSTNVPSASSSPSRKSSSSSDAAEFSHEDVRSVILRWARDKSTGGYMMSFVKVYGSGWAFEWLLDSTEDDTR